MATVWIPSLMRDLTAGRTQVVVAGRTVGAIIDALEEACPGFKARLTKGQSLDPAIRALVDGRAALLGLNEPVRQDSEIHFVPTIAGG